MQDRFKFRAYDTDKKLMVYCWSEATEEQKKQYCEIYGKDEAYNCWQSCQLDCLDDYDNEYYHCIVEQCTGLKDKNGKLIYEGDIVETQGIKKIVKYNQSSCCFVFHNIGTIISHHIEDSWLNEFPTEIIGNIHENADLIQVKGVKNINTYAKMLKIQVKELGDD